MTAVPPTAGRTRRLAELGAALRAAGYTPHGLAAALGSEGPLVEGRTVGDRLRRARRAGALGLLARLLLLDDAVAAAEVADLPLAATLLDLGLATEEPGRLTGTVTVVPHDDLLVASDRFGVGGEAMVPGVQPPSHLLGCLAIRRPVERALDLGTGCGIQALLLAPLAGRVIATDVSERALAYAELNAALNGVANIEPRLGSLFEPVAGERFGVLVANPPYVISPDRRFTFRDSELGGEEISATVVRGAPAHLVAGGHATVLASWDATGDDPLATPAGWIGEGCDAVVLGTAVLDAERNAERWNVGAERDAAVERWTAHFAELGIARVGYGAVVLRRRADGAGRVRALRVGPAVEGPAGGHLLRLLDAPERLADDARVRMVGGARLDERLRVADGGWAIEGRELVLVDGLRLRADLDADAAAVVARLDGTRPLVEAAPTADARRFVEQLVGLGFAEALTA